MMRWSLSAGSFGRGWLLLMALLGPVAACRSHAPVLISPEQAQDQVYDARSRAAAAAMTGNVGAARAQREAAKRYQRLVREGKTTTPDQALARASEHGDRAEAYQRSGMSRFVQAELDRAASYEDFAVSTGGLPPTTVQTRAADHRARADAFSRMGWQPLARHHRQRAERLESALRVTPPSP
jgi:hypothetical protein